MTIKILLVAILLCLLNVQCFPTRLHKVYNQSIPAHFHEVYLAKGEIFAGNITSNYSNTLDVSVYFYMKGQDMSQEPQTSTQVYHKSDTLTCLSFTPPQSSTYYIVIKSLNESISMDFRLTFEIKGQDNKIFQNRVFVYQQFFLPSQENNSAIIKIQPITQRFCMKDYLIKFVPPKGVKANLFLIRNQNEYLQLTDYNLLNQQIEWIELQNFNQNQVWHLKLIHEDISQVDDTSQYSIQIYQMISNQVEFKLCCQNKGFIPDSRNLKCVIPSTYDFSVPTTDNDIRGNYPNKVSKFLLPSIVLRKNLRTFVPNNYLKRKNIVNESQMSEGKIALIISTVLGSLLLIVIAFGVGCYCFNLKYMADDDSKPKPNEREAKNKKKKSIKEQLQNLQSELNDQILGESSCSVCLQQKCNVILDCGHCFHLLCLVDWIKKRNQCPNCRKFITLIQIKKSLHRK